MSEEDDAKADAEYRDYQHDLEMERMEGIAQRDVERERARIREKAKAWFDTRDPGYVKRFIYNLDRNEIETIERAWEDFEKEVFGEEI